MAEFTEESTFPFPRDQLWKLLEAHWDDATIPQIHPLVRSQKTLRRSSNEIVVQRSIDARGKLLSSQWKISLHPPDYLRYDIVSGEGPYAPGTIIETQYSDAPGGTHLKTHVNGRITVLPFFFPQKLFLRRVLDGIDQEDEAYLRR